MGIVDLWRAGDQVLVKEREVSKLMKENEILKEKIAQVESPLYLEKAARDKLNLAKPGEYVVILPKETSASTSAMPVDSRPNWQKWKEVIF